MGDSQVGRFGRSVRDVAAELDCDWHVVNDAVQAYGSALLDAPGRVGTVTALGLDETLFVRRGNVTPRRGRPRSLTCAAE